MFSNAFAHLEYCFILCIIFQQSLYHVGCQGACPHIRDVLGFYPKLFSTSWNQLSFVRDSMRGDSLRVRKWLSPPVLCSNPTSFGRSDAARRFLLAILSLLSILGLLPTNRYLIIFNEKNQRNYTTRDQGQPYCQSDHCGGAQSSLSILNEKSGPPFCLIPGLFGRTNNNIISIASALEQARANGTNLALLGVWGKFFETHLEPHPEIVTKEAAARQYSSFPSSANECSASVDGKDAYFLVGGPQKRAFIDALQEILPKRATRERAVRILLDDFGLNESSGSDNIPPSMPFFSVHRRWLEGTCYRRSKRRVNNAGIPTCTPELTKQACDINFQTALTTYNPRNLTTILFTDRQRDDLDNTFPVQSDYDFWEELWMMTQSKKHYGNPLSTVDYVVMHWRYGWGNFETIEPSECFPRHKGRHS